MKWHPTVLLNDMHKFREFFPLLGNKTMLALIVKVLRSLQNAIKYPVAILLPEDVLEYEGDQESLRALRILGALREAGIIASFATQMHTYPDEPLGYVTLATRSGRKMMGMSGKGAHLSSKAATLWPALGETVERESLNDPYVRPNEYRDTSWSELHGAKMDIFSVAGFHEALEKKGHPHFTFAYDANTVFRWVPCEDLLHARPIWAPLQLFSFAHVREHVKTKHGNAEEGKEPLLSFPITTGAAAGQTKHDATFRGLCEVVERDAFMIYWLNQIAADRIDIASFGEKRFDAILSLASDYRLELHALYLKTDVPLHTVCVIVLDRSGAGPALMVTAKTGVALSDIIYDCLQDMLAQRGNFRATYERHKQEGDPSKAVYDMDQAGRMRLWSQVSQLQHLEHFISGELKDTNSFPTYRYSGDSASDLKEALRFFAEKEYEVIARELITPQLRDLTDGLSVVMVRIPQMIPLYLDESLRGIKGERLRNVPKMLGHHVNETKDDPFCVVPHPFP